MAKAEMTTKLKPNPIPTRVFWVKICSAPGFNISKLCISLGVCQGDHYYNIPTFHKNKFEDIHFEEKNSPPPLNPNCIGV